MKKDDDKALKRLQELKVLLAQHDERYYKEASPIISDKAYDLLKKELEQLELVQDPLGLFTEFPEGRKSVQIPFFRLAMTVWKNLHRINMQVPC